jgi:hypothetical protein
MPNEELSRASEEAMLENDAHQVDRNQDGSDGRKVQQEFHEPSQAAHLNANKKQHTKPEGNLRQGSAPGALRQPPKG